MNTSSKTDIATGAQAAAGASRGVVTPTQLTLAAVALTGGASSDPGVSALRPIPVLPLW